MYCLKCGSQVNEGERFCPNCGADQAAAAGGAPINQGVKSYIPATSGNVGIYNIVMYVLWAFVAIGTFLPYASASAFGMSVSETLWGAESALGLFVFICGIAGAVLHFFGKKKLMIIPAIVPCGLMLLLAVSKGDVAYGDMISFGIGYWLMLIGSLGAIILPFTPLAKK